MGDPASVRGLLLASTASSKMNVKMILTVMVKVREHNLWMNGIESLTMFAGTCVNIDGTNYPKLQCYCNPGFFGSNCQKTSSIDSNEINEALYEEVALPSGNGKFLWRILENSQRMEGVIQADTTSYLAIGKLSIDFLKFLPGFM